MGSASDLAYAALRDSILAGEYKPGVRLRETDLASSLGVSRTPIREALRRLVAEGMVEVELNRGAVVAEWAEAEIDEIFELRSLLEGYGARRAATRISAEELQHLDHLCAAMEDLVRERGPGNAGLADLNLEFHSRIMQASGNARLSALLGSVIHVPVVQRTFERYEPGALARSFAHHRELVDSLRAGDARWAESVMFAHIQAARAVYTSARGDE